MSNKKQWYLGLAELRDDNCDECKKCGGQRAQIREVRVTCPPCTSCPLRPWVVVTVSRASSAQQFSVYMRSNNERVEVRVALIIRQMMSKLNQSCYRYCKLVNNEIKIWLPHVHLYLYCSVDCCGKCHSWQKNGQIMAEQREEKIKKFRPNVAKLFGISEK